jgi:protocatechuate 3,4-dioxygenase beta subunit
MTEGPFYPRAIPKDIDGDLTRVMGRSAVAQGTVLDVTGRIVDRTGKPMARAKLEGWQCDNLGLYHHVGDMQPRAIRISSGFGAVSTDEEGRYAFPAPSSPCRTRGARRTSTSSCATGSRTARSSRRCSIEGGAGNEQDFLYRNLGKKAER